MRSGLARNSVGSILGEARRTTQASMMGRELTLRGSSTDTTSGPVGAAASGEVTNAAVFDIALFDEELFG